MLANEKEIIHRAQRGDRDALATLYREHYSAIFNYFFYRLGDQTTAEDLTAEVFVRMVDKIDGYRYRGKPILAWLYTIARNLLINYRQRAENAPKLPLEERLVASDGNPVQAAERRLTVDCLQLALNYLTDVQRQVIIGKFIEGRSTAEVAKILNKTEGAIKSLQHRALGALRRAMEKENCYEP